MKFCTSALPRLIAQPVRSQSQVSRLRLGIVWQLHKYLKPARSSRTWPLPTLRVRLATGTFPPLRRFPPKKHPPP